MRALAGAIVFLAACAAADPSPAPTAEAQTTITTTPAREQFIIPPAPASGNTEAWPRPVLAPVAYAPPPRNLTLVCEGAFAQGGLALCRTLPHAEVFVDDVSRGRADAEGWAVIGFDRDSPAQSTVRVERTVTPPGPAPHGFEMQATRTYDIAPRTFDIDRVDNLPPQTVTPTDPEVVQRLAREREIKNVGFASRAETEGWLDGFRWPVNGRISGSWGNQRVLNGEPRSPHYGVDIAMPIGTPVLAPASGVVSLAETDTYLEGGLVFIDHGQGLISMYLHMSELNVRAGERVTPGQQIGLVGNRGRANGPHLCWRLKWRDRNLDPSLAILALANARSAFAAP